MINKKKRLAKIKLGLCRLTQLLWGCIHGRNETKQLLNSSSLHQLIKKKKTFLVFTLKNSTVHVHGLPVHDQGIQRGLPRLVWAPAIAYRAIALLHFTTGTALLHCIQHWATRLQGTPCYSVKQWNIQYTIYYQTGITHGVGSKRPPTAKFYSSLIRLILGKVAGNLDLTKRRKFVHSSQYTFANLI